MELSELRPGDKVLIEATVTKVVDDGEGAEPFVLVSVANVNTLGAREDARSVALVTAEQIHQKLSSQAAPATSEWPLGTLARDVHMP